MTMPGNTESSSQKYRPDTIYGIRATKNEQNRGCCVDIGTYRFEESSIAMENIIEQEELTRLIDVEILSILDSGY